MFDSEVLASVGGDKEMYALVRYAQERGHLTYEEIVTLVEDYKGWDTPSADQSLWALDRVLGMVACSLGKGRNRALPRS